MSAPRYSAVAQREHTDDFYPHHQPRSRLSWPHHCFVCLLEVLRVPLMVLCICCGDCVGLRIAEYTRHNRTVEESVYATSAHV